MCLLKDGRNLTIPKMQACIESAFGDVCDYDTMIRSLCELKQNDSKSVEENMLEIHEAVAVMCCTYMYQISDLGKNLIHNRFYHVLSPSLHNALCLLCLSCWRGNR